MIPPPTSQMDHHHKVTNITMPPTSLTPLVSILKLSKTSFLNYFLRNLINVKSDDNLTNTQNVEWVISNAQQIRPFGSENRLIRMQ